MKDPIRKLLHLSKVQGIRRTISRLPSLPYPTSIRAEGEVRITPNRQLPGSEENRKQLIHVYLYKHVFWTVSWGIPNKRFSRIRFLSNTKAYGYFRLLVDYHKLKVETEAWS